jgi:iron complex transport system substrate-binding protein
MVIRDDASIFDTYSLLADITGTQDRMTFLKARYGCQIAQIKRLIDISNMTSSVFQGNEGRFYVEHTYGPLGRVLRDAGFKFPATEQLNAVVSDVCQDLTACQHNQLITIPREEASSNLFYALGAISYMIISNISGRDFVPFEGN